jgi:hypothetical protein
MVRFFAFHCFTTIGAVIYLASLAFRPELVLIGKSIRQYRLKRCESPRKDLRMGNAEGEMEFLLSAGEGSSAFFE